MTEQHTYLTLEHKNLLLQAKLDDEGIVLDLFNITNKDDPIEIKSTHITYNEIKTHRISTEPCNGCKDLIEDENCHKCENEPHSGYLYRENFYTEKDNEDE